MAVSTCSIILLANIFMIVITVSSRHIDDESMTEETELHQITRNHTSDHIKCTLPHCVVVCDVGNVCSNTIIDGTESELFEVICSAEYACSDTIIKGARHVTTIHCTEQQACSDAIFDVQNSYNVHVNCTHHWSCYGNTVNAISSSNLTIQITNATKLQFDCIVHPKKMYCSSFSLYCDTSPGYEFYDNGNDNPYDLSQSAYLDLNGTYDMKMDPVTVHFSKYITPFDYHHYVCLDDHWEVAHHKMHCASHEPFCPVDCSIQDCTNVLINGSTVTTSLYVLCAVGWYSNVTITGCVDATIICPTQTASKCTVYCLTQDACKGLTIEANDAYSVLVNCVGFGSCKYMTLNATNAHSLHLNCTCHGNGQNYKTCGQT
eukprot:766182_1